MQADKILHDLLEKSFRQTLVEILPRIIGEVMSSNKFFVGQEFIPIEEAASRYNLSKRTIYNYHYREHITLHSTDGKTYVSIIELEAYIRSNPLKRLAK